MQRLDGLPDEALRRVVAGVEVDPVIGEVPIRRALAWPVRVSCTSRALSGSGHRSVFVVMSCGRCGSNIDAVPTGEPCPTCGDTSRNATVSAGGVLVATSVLTPSVAVQPAPDRPWFDKWIDMQRAIERLRSAYKSVPSGGNVEVDGYVRQFFGACHDMRDWLRCDQVNLPSLDYSKLSAHIAGDPDLEVASGFANTDKHHTRHGPDPLTVKISNTLTGPTGARVTLTYSSPKRTVRTCDALDLAERCLQSWRAFLTSQGIALP